MTEHWHAPSGAVLCTYMRSWLFVPGIRPNMIAKDINRIFLSDVYSGTAYPLYQWMDDLEIWNGFPSDASPH